MSESYLPVSSSAVTVAGGTIAVSAVTGTVTTAATSLLPGGATSITGVGSGSNAVITGTLAGVGGKTTYIVGFEITGAGAIVGLPVTVTVTGILGGTLSYTYAAIAGVLLGNGPLIVDYGMGLPSAALGGNIVVSCPALGLGNTANTVVVRGYVL